MDAEELLARPLVARVATSGPHGPTVRPVWFLFEKGVLWWLTGSYSRLGEWLVADPRASAVVDTCDLESGEVRAVALSGQATVHPFDRALATRKLTKYLGPQVEKWPERFRAVLDGLSAGLIALTPTRHRSCRTCRSHLSFVDLRISPSTPMVVARLPGERASVIVRRGEVDDSCR